MPISSSASNTPRKVPPRSKQSSNRGVSFSAAVVHFGTIDGPQKLDLVAAQ
jgi:hypothetical protein